jgi:hypothetical protein
MVKYGGPAWWVLCALVPLMGGLLAVEHRASLPPGWHTFVQIIIVLFIYSLVWLWLRANTFALLRAGQDRYVRTYAGAASRTALRSLRPRRRPGPAYVHYVRLRRTTRDAKAKTDVMEITRCSLN